MIRIETVVMVTATSAGGDDHMLNLRFGPGDMQSFPLETAELHLAIVPANEADFFSFPITDPSYALIKGAAAARGRRTARGHGRNHVPAGTRRRP